MAGMAIGIYKLLKSRSLDGLKLEELQLMEIKLNKKIDELNEEIKEIEKAIERLFEKARGAKTKSEEISLANRIKTLNQKKEMKQSAVIQLEKELRAVSNLLILKENEKDLKEAGVWNKLKKLEPEKIEKWLSSKTLERRDRQALINDIVSLTSTAMKSIDYDEDLEEILDIIKEVKKGEMDIKEASKKIKEKE
ncbi:MAG TPA: hypothetical protein ENI52_01655 [Thermoplasmata archaeon]|nr:hypothetical protein [Thermoplasmata archaeon]